MGLSKQLLNATFETDLPPSLDREAQAQAMAAVSAEMAEGMAAFSEKRSPRLPCLAMSGLDTDRRRRAAAPRATR